MLYFNTNVGATLKAPVEVGGCVSKMTTAGQEVVNSYRRVSMDEATLHRSAVPPSKHRHLQACATFFRCWKETSGRRLCGIKSTLEVREPST